MSARTRCSYCNTPVPVLASQCVADGRAGLLHVDCAQRLRAKGWEPGQPVLTAYLVDHLKRLEAELAEKGGRDDVLAARIDALREYLQPDPT